MIPNVGKCVAKGLSWPTPRNGKLGSWAVAGISGDIGVVNGRFIPLSECAAAPGIELPHSVVVLVYLSL